VSTNIVEAASRALLEVINRIELSQKSGTRPASERREEAARIAKTAV
jgi:hypothetical protein